MIKVIWNDFNQALINGDQATAESLMTPTFRNHMSEVLTVLMPEFSTIIASYTDFDAMDFKDGYASYLLNRTVGGEDLAFFVYFLRDDSGLWRLISM